LGGVNYNHRKTRKGVEEGEVFPQLRTVAVCGVGGGERL